MSLSQILISEPKPLPPRGSPEVYMYLNSLHSYLNRIFSRFTEDQLKTEVLPQGVSGNILYHNGTSWIVLAPPSLDGTYSLELTKSGSTIILAWA
jgi:hypothetical protein